MLIRLYFFYLTTISTIMATQKTPLPYDGTLALRRERKSAYPMIYLLCIGKNLLRFLGFQGIRHEALIVP